MRQNVSVIVVSGVVKVDPVWREGLLALIEPLVAATNREDGCISYEFFEDPFRPGRFRVFEEWSSHEALTSHFETSHMAAFWQGLTELGEIEADVVRYEIARYGPNR